MRKLFTLGLALATFIAAAGAYAQVNYTINAQTGTTYTFVNTDCGKLITFNNIATITATVPQPSSPSGGGAGAGTFMPPCTLSIRNLAEGSLVLVPTASTIGGANQVTLTGGVGFQEGIVIASDGANWQVASGVTYFSTY